VGAVQETMNPYENICTLLNVIESLVTCTIKAVFIHKPQYSVAHYVEDVQCLLEVLASDLLCIHCVD